VKTHTYHYPHIRFNGENICIASLPTFIGTVCHLGRRVHAYATFILDDGRECSGKVLTFVNDVDCRTSYARAIATVVQPIIYGMDFNGRKMFTNDGKPVLIRHSQSKVGVS